MSTQVTQPPMDLADQTLVYEAIKIVHEAEQAWWFAVNDGTSRGSPKERYIVLALLEAGWRPPGAETPARIDVTLWPRSGRVQVYEHTESDGSDEPKEWGGEQIIREMRDSG